LTEGPAAKPRSRYRRLALELGVVVLVLGAVRAYRMRDLVAGDFPQRDVLALDGTGIHLGAPQPELTLVHVWATWCPTCRAMEGAVEDAAQHLRVVTIAAQSGSDSAVRAYAAERGVRVPIINDARGELTHALGVRAYPTTLFVDATGRIAAREVGYTTSWGLRARALLARLW
jgi:thiol-disulfide isomerase/thioredoxin